MFCSDDGGVKVDQLPAAAAEREDAEKVLSGNTQSVSVQTFVCCNLSSCSYAAFTLKV